MIKIWNGNMPYKLKEIAPNVQARDGVDFEPYMTAYPAGSKGAVIVLPGGGYVNRAPHEGDTFGEWFQSIGITAFVFQYRVAPNAHPAELSDVQRVIRYVRHHADEYGIDRNKIAIMGFSAGGHLAGSASVHYDKKAYEPIDEIDNESARPDLSILCYPVIDMRDYRHDGSKINLIGHRPTENMKDFMSLHMQVTSDTPEAFIWHTSSDDGVPVMNSILYAQALSRENINFEMHIYPLGCHGLGLAPNEEYVAKWSKNLEAWLTLKEWK